MRLFNTTATSYTTQGLGVLSDVISGTVVEEINGSYELSFEYPISGHLYEELQLRRIVYVEPTPYAEPQPFRIYNISKPINMIVTVNAEHISYDLSGYPVPIIKMTSAKNAMSELKKNSIIQCPFTFTSSVDKSATVEIKEPKSIRAVLGTELIETYGGELEFDNFVVKHVPARGYSKQVYVRYGKNLTDLTQDEYCNEVFTGVYPYYAYNDVGDESTSDDNKRVVMTLPEKIVKADGTFDFERISPLDASEHFSEPPKEAELREWAKEWVKKNKIGIPKVQLTVSFTDALGNVEVELGDKIKVEFLKLGVKADARCIKTTYNITTKRYDEIELGEAQSNLASTIVDGNTEIKQEIANEFIKFGIEVDNIKIGFAQIEELVAGKIDVEYLEANIIKAINASIESAVIDQAKIGNLDAGKITAGEIDTDILKSNIIEAINLSAESATINEAKIGDLSADKITSGEINTDILSANIIEAINLSAESATIDEAKIGDLSADKITSGQIDTNILSANVIDAINISAGTIDADNINVEQLDAELITADRLSAEVIDAINLYAGSAVIAEAKIADLSADKITSGFISADRIEAGSLSAGKLDADDINTIKLDASQITADAIAAGEIKVGDINMTEAGISFANITKVKITNAHMSEAFIADAYVKNIQADVIKGGTLDAKDITVNNLSADSITVGKINGHQIQQGEIGWDHLDDLLNGDIRNTIHDVDKALTDAGIALSKVEQTSRSLITEFTKTNSPTNRPLPTASWTTLSPSWGNGYIWMRTKTTMNDKPGTVIYSNPVCMTGEKGDQGLRGPIGPDGTPSYFHVKYSNVPNPTEPSQMTETPSTYIGTCVNPVASDPISPEYYTWSRFEGAQGPKGDKGVDGGKGADGLTTYLHIKYSDDGVTFTGDSGETPGDWMGQYVDNTEADSTTFSKYKWSKIKGDDGLRGLQGPKGDKGIDGVKGTDGVSTYFHIKYSALPNPTQSSQMTETPSTYIGTYTSTNPTDSTNPASYTWARFQGIQGPKGDKGIDGGKGADGLTNYLHIKYSNDGRTFTDNNGETPGEWIGQYVDNTETDSNVFSKYKWSKIKGIGVATIVAEYYVSTSKTVQTGGSWSTKSPTWSANKYVWTRSKITYTDGDVEYTTPMCDSSWEAIYDLEVGGKNMVRNSGDFTNLKYWGFNSSQGKLVPSTLTNGTVIGVYNYDATPLSVGTDRMVLSPNTEYAIGATVYAKECISEVQVLIRNKDNTDSDVWAYDTSVTIEFTDSKYVRKKTTFRTGNNVDTCWIRLCNKGKNPDASESASWLYNVMLVKGNTLPQWAPHPDDVRDFTIGGTNMLRNSNFKFGLDYIGRAHYDTAGSNHNLRVIPGDYGDAYTVPGHNKLQISSFNATDRFGAAMTFKTEPGKKYMISGYMAQHRCYSVEVAVRDIMSKPLMTIRPPVASGGTSFSKWTKIEIPFTSTEAARTIEFLITKQSHDVSYHAMLWLCDMKIEEGEYATAWSPSPLDVDAQLEDVVSLANGKTTAYYSASPPSAEGKKENDIWFDTDNGYKMYYFTNGAWYPTQFDTEAIAAYAITADKIEARTITAGKIATGTLTANEIAALTITGDKIHANTITVGKLAANSVVAGNIESNQIQARHLVAGEITSDKLDTDELFVGGNSFITNLKALEIAAENITTGKISSERLDITGLVAFESFDDDIQRMFNVQGDKTYIDGGTIAANTIMADKINLKSGLTVQNDKNDITFAVSSSGEVQVNGLLQSSNFSENRNTGYRITTDGVAVLNQARITGEILLPNAGMTNYGAMIGNENHIPGTTKEVETVYTGTYGHGVILNKDSLPVGIKPGDVCTLSAKIKTHKFIVPPSANLLINHNQGYLLSDGRVNNDGGWKYTDYIAVSPNTFYSISNFTNLGINPSTCFYDSSKRFITGINNGNGGNNPNVTNKCETLFTPENAAYMRCSFPASDVSEIRIGVSKGVRVRMVCYHDGTSDHTSYYGEMVYPTQEKYSKVTFTCPATATGYYVDINKEYVDINKEYGDVYTSFSEVKLEKGTERTPWCPSSQDNIDHIRMWAGKSYEDRASAPFRVTQSGNVYANNVDLSGILHGEIDSGDVQLKRNALTMNRAGTEIEIMRFQPDGSYLDNSFIFGNPTVRHMYYQPLNSKFEFNNCNAEFNGQGATSIIIEGSSPSDTNSGIRLVATDGTGHHMIRHSGYKPGSLIFFSQGINESYDFVFRRAASDERVEVAIDGSLQIIDNITGSNNPVEMRSSSSGWAFYSK